MSRDCPRSWLSVTRPPRSAITEPRSASPAACGRPPARAAIGACLLSATLTLFGCTVQSGLPGPNVLLDTPLGPVPLSSSAPGVAGSWVGPPGALPGPAVSRDGRYAGGAVVLATDGGLCTKPLAISGFVVKGNSARYGRFHGTIDADGGLQMAYGATWIVGQFEGAVFRGQLSVPGPFKTVGCTYILSLERTGA
jgi:hypothetical protein